MKMHRIAARKCYKVLQVFTHSLSHESFQRVGGGADQVHRFSQVEPSSGKLFGISLGPEPQILVRRITVGVLAGGAAFLVAVGIFGVPLKSHPSVGAGDLTVESIEVIQREGQKCSVDLTVKNVGSTEVAGTLDFVLNLRLISETPKAGGPSSGCLDKMVVALCEKLEQSDELLTEQTLAAVNSADSCAHLAELPEPTCRLEGRSYLALKKGEVRLIRLTPEIPDSYRLGGGSADILKFSAN